MPELPEVETIARGLAGRIVGARVTSVWGSGKPLHLRRAVDLAGVRRALLDRRIAGVRRRGKYLLVDAAGPDGAGLLVQSTKPGGFLRLCGHRSESEYRTNFLDNPV